MSIDLHWPEIALRLALTVVARPAWHRTQQNGARCRTAHELRDRLQAANFHIKSLSLANCVKEQLTTLDCEVRWPSPHGAAETPHIITELEHMPGLVKLEWKVFGSGPQ